MEEILIIIIQVLFEFVLNVMINIPFDYPSKNRSTNEPESVFLACFIWFLLASLLGWLSLFLFKYTLLALPILRIANLILAPIVSAMLSKAIAERRAEQNHFIIPRNHFWQAYWFTLGFAMVRFAYAAHR
jgi:hypothetical protein